MPNLRGQPFLAYLSQRLKWAFLIKICPLLLLLSSLSSLVLLLALLYTFHIYIFFSRTTGPISTKLGTLHPWVKKTQVCSNEGFCPFPRGDNYEIVKIYWQNLKIFSSRTTGPISTKLHTMPPWVKGIQVCSNEGLHLFLRGNTCNKEIAEIH